MRWLVEIALLSLCVLTRAVPRFESNSIVVENKRSSIVGLHATPQACQTLLYEPFDENSARQNKAICNDGSVGGIYFQPGQGAQAKHYIIFFQGGWSCWDNSSCVQRFNDTPNLMSSKNWATSLCLNGIFDTASSIANFSKVYVPYCTSDSWVGDSAGDDSTHFEFRGDRVVRYLMNYHIRERLMDADRIVLSGCSAGGRGSLYNLDLVCSSLPRAVPCVGVADAAWWIDAGAIPPLIPLRDLMKKGVPLWNASIELDECDTIDCTFSWNLLKLIKTPFLVHSELFDAFQLTMDVGNLPWDEQQQEFVKNFSQQMRANLTAIASVRPGTAAVFSTGCHDHCTSDSDGFFHYKTSQSQLAFNDAVRMFLFENVVESIIEECEEMNCSESCPSN